MKKQQTLVLIKPDGVKRGLIGKIVSRFEQVGLTIIGLKFISPSEKQIRNHYPSSPQWYKTVGQRTLDNYKKKKLDPIKILGTSDPETIGKMVKKWLIEYLQESPILCLVIQGYEAITVVRKICGNTIPLDALPGTIRGDFSHDNIDLANEKARPLRNLIHASDNPLEAQREIKVWFKKEELFTYQRADEKIQFP